MYVAVGREYTAGYIFTSDDGLAWTKRVGLGIVSGLPLLRAITTCSPRQISRPVSGSIAPTRLPPRLPIFRDEFDVWRRAVLSAQKMNQDGIMNGAPRSLRAATLSCSPSPPGRSCSTIAAANPNHCASLSPPSGDSTGPQS